MVQNRSALEWLLPNYGRLTRSYLSPHTQELNVLQPVWGILLDDAPGAQLACRASERGSIPLSSAMISVKYLNQPAGYFLPMQLGAVPQVGDGIEGVTSYRADGEAKTFRIKSVVHCAGADGWAPALKVELE